MMMMMMTGIRQNHTHSTDGPEEVSDRSYLSVGVLSLNGTPAIG